MGHISDNHTREFKYKVLTVQNSKTSWIPAGFRGGYVKVQMDVKWIKKKWANSLYILIHSEFQLFKSKAFEL